MFKNTKRWLIALLVVFVILSGVMSSVIIVIDPYFHYHGPLEGYYYNLDNERSQNDGIIRHFDYTGMIIGLNYVGILA